MSFEFAFDYANLLVQWVLTWLAANSMSVATSQQLTGAILDFMHAAQQSAQAMV